MNESQCEPTHETLSEKTGVQTQIQEGGVQIKHSPVVRDDPLSLMGLRENTETLHGLPFTCFDAHVC